MTDRPEYDPPDPVGEWYRVGLAIVIAIVALSFLV